MTSPTAAEDLELFDVLVPAVDDALADIDAAADGGQPLPPSEQLARLAVGAVRALAPLLRAERDRLAVEVDGDQQPGK